MTSANQRSFEKKIENVAIQRMSKKELFIIAVEDRRIHEYKRWVIK